MTPPLAMAGGFLLGCPVAPRRGARHPRRSRRADRPGRRAGRSARSCWRGGHWHDRASESPRVPTGLDVLVSERFARLRGRKVGLIANPEHRRSAAAARDRPAARGRRGRPGPALRPGARPPGRRPGHDRRRLGGRPPTGLPVVSLYGDGPESLKPRRDDLDGLDLPGLRRPGRRVTLLHLLRRPCSMRWRPRPRPAAPFLVLDRPEPDRRRGGRGADRPARASRASSAPTRCPIRHGMTVGELAISTDPTARSTWSWRSSPAGAGPGIMFWAETGLHWVMPSPNMPTAGHGDRLSRAAAWSRGRTSPKGGERPGRSNSGAPPGSRRRALRWLEAIAVLPGVGLRPIRLPAGVPQA